MLEIFYSSEIFREHQEFMIVLIVTHHYDDLITTRNDNLYNQAALNVNLHSCLRIIQGMIGINNIHKHYVTTTNIGVNHQQTEEDGTMMKTRYART